MPSASDKNSADPPSQDEAAQWSHVKDLIHEKDQEQKVQLGDHWSFNLRNDPKRFAFVLARYKFAAKMLSKGRSVLELGCSEGIGCPILSEFARSYTGVDFDAGAIRSAQRNWNSEKCSFIEADFMEERLGQFESVLSLDVIEHIMPEVEERYWQSLCEHLTPDGVAIVGTPNCTASAYASKASQVGHVNLFSAERLVKTAQDFFHNVFLFGMNDEVVHCGFSAMAHYLIVLACNKK